MTSTIAKLGFTLGLASMALATLPAQVLANSTSQSVTLQTPARIHDGLNSPVGMAYDTSGNLYVANWSAGTVLRFTPDGQRRVFAKGLSGPSGLAISTGGDIYVASYSENVVWRFTPSGEQSVFIRGLATPAGLSFDAHGRLLIANRQTNQILAAHPNGKIDVVAQDLQTPVGAIELPGGDLIVSNIAGSVSLVSGSTRAVVINTSLGSPGPGIVLAGDDSAYVVDYGGTTVNHIDRNGKRTVIADGLRSPVGLALAPDGSLTVATWSANAAFRIELNRQPGPPN